jgi:serine/threonine-protein kinase
MELLEGSSLSDALDAVGPMPAARAVEIVRQVLQGLGAAHAKGIVHRDMKPENVFLTTKGGRADFTKIMDFGISKFMISTESKVRLTATGAVIGTPVYMAPEQAMAIGDVDARVDLYAVGVMLYELLAGHPPFQAPSYIALVTQHLNLAPPPLGAARPDLPRALVKAVHKALEKDPARRFQSAAEMAAAIPHGAALMVADQLATLGSSDEYPALSASHTAAASPLAMARAQSTPGFVTPGPSGAVGVLPTGSQMIGMAAPQAGAPARSRWPLAIAGIAVLAAAVILAVGLGGERGGSAPAAAVGSQPGSASAAPAPVAEVMAVEVGNMEIVSTPPGATVLVDGVERGKTPLVVAEVAPGIHVIRLVKAGYADVELNKLVRAGRDETISAAMGKVVPGRVGPKTGRPGGTVQVTPQPEPTKVEPRVEPKVAPRVKEQPRNPYDDVPADPGGKKKNPYD